MAVGTYQYGRTNLIYCTMDLTDPNFQKSIIKKLHIILDIFPAASSFLYLHYDFLCMNLFLDTYCINN